MKHIKLTQNQVAIVDDEDFDLSYRFKSWQVTSNGYAISHKMIDYKKFYFLMHRVIMERILGMPIPEGLIVDHINRNRLDNRRENIRLATYSQNNINSKMFSHNISGYKGVGFHNKRNQWRARIGKIHLGWFATIEEAIEARQQAEEMIYHRFSSK